MYQDRLACVVVASTPQKFCPVLPPTTTTTTTMYPYDDQMVVLLLFVDPGVQTPKRWHHVLALCKEVGFSWALLPPPLTSFSTLVLEGFLCTTLNKAVR